MENAVRVRELVAFLEGGEKRGDVLRECRDFLKRHEKFHGRLCAAMVKGWREEEDEKEGCRQILQTLGPGPAFVAIHATITTSQLSAARWLCGEVCHLLAPPQLSTFLYSQCHHPVTTSHPHHLTPTQENLVGLLCRLPDILTNRMGCELPSSLLPHQYFTAIGHSLVDCLQQVYKALKKSEDCALAFPAAVAGKSSLLGHKDEVLSPLVPVLARLAPTDPLWQRVACTFFARVPSNCLEPILDGLIRQVTPSLKLPTSLYSLLGDLPLTNHKARFLLTHKLFLVKVPASPGAIFTLIGYLASSSALRALMGPLLQSTLEVWSDASALRHMDSRQHLWLSKILVLGVTCLTDSELAPMKSALQRQVMAGVQTHLGSPLEGIRQLGMAVGESLMNRFHPSLPDKHRLSFDYQPGPDVQAVLQLARPVDVQEAELRLCHSNRTPAPPTPVPASPGAGERFGEGMVRTTEADSDSDDDLVPYALDSDPDTSQPPPPRYLRTLLQALLSSTDPLQQETALKSAESLIRSDPPDLSEVCGELTKVLLHLADTFALPEFTDLRLRSMVSLAATCPAPSARYLTTEFYAPNYSIRQRMDILEVLSAAALELATPIPAATPPPPAVLGGLRLQRPWEEVIKERLKSKTRVISKGPRQPPPSASPNRFAAVAGLFFFPLMVSYDNPLNTLQLLGQDCLVLGNLLHTLGTMMHCASNTPLSPAMASALMDFLWALRYHHSQYVRQGVLFALGMVLAATPPHALLTEVDGTLSEALHWVKDVCVNDADSQCRSLAQHTLALFNATVAEVQK